MRLSLLGVITGELRTSPRVREVNLPPDGSRLGEIQRAANVCLESAGEERYFQDEFIDVYTEGLWDASGVTYTVVAIKPRRGGSERTRVYHRNNATGEVLEYHPQTDFWEDYLLEVAEKLRAASASSGVSAPEAEKLHDIPKDDYRRKLRDKYAVVAKRRAEMDNRA